MLFKKFTPPRPYCVVFPSWVTVIILKYGSQKQRVTVVKGSDMQNMLEKPKMCKTWRSFLKNSEQFNCSGHTRNSWITCETHHKNSLHLLFPQQSQWMFHGICSIKTCKIIIVFVLLALAHCVFLYLWHWWRWHFYDLLMHITNRFQRFQILFLSTVGNILPQSEINQHSPYKIHKI